MRCNCTLQWDNRFNDTLSHTFTQIPCDTANKNWNWNRNESNEHRTRALVWCCFGRNCGGCIDHQFSNDRRNFTASIPNMTKYYIWNTILNGWSVADSMQMRDKEIVAERLCRAVYKWTCPPIHVFDFNGKRRTNERDSHRSNLSLPMYNKSRTHKWSFREEIKWKIIIIKRQTRNHNAMNQRNKRKIQKKHTHSQTTPHHK